MCTTILLCMAMQFCGGFCNMARNLWRFHKRKVNKIEEIQMTESSHQITQNYGTINDTETHVLIDPVSNFFVSFCFIE